MTLSPARLAPATPTRLALLLIVASLCAGCAPTTSHSSGTAAGGTLELAGEDFRSLDPAHGYDVGSWGIERVIYTGLLDYDSHANLIPHGAERWSISPDGKTYTFFLRHDVRFAGPITCGRPVTSADYAYELRRVLAKKTASQGLGFYTTIVGATPFHDGKTNALPGVDTRNPYRLVIHLTQPNLAFLNIMAMPFAFAVPHEVVEKYGEPAFTEHAEGSGPFMLHSWRRQVDITLDRNPDYWEKGKPRLERIHMRFGIDDLNSMMMFESGELGLSSIPTADFVRVTHNPRFKPFILQQPDIAIFYLSLNCEMPPLNNVKVRQAINYAIDKKRILQIQNNRGVVATQVLPPAMPGFDPSIKGYPHDPARARQLLREAGLGNGFSTTLWYRNEDTSSEAEKIAQAVQQDLKGVGIHMDFKPVTFAVLQDAVEQERKVPISIDDWYQDFPDPSDFLDVLLNSKQATPGSGNNNAFYKSKEMDALLAKAAAEQNPARRLNLYKQAGRVAVRDAPWVFLYYPIRYVLKRPYVHGFSLHPVWPAVYENIWISR